MEVVLRLLEVGGMQVAVHLPHVRERGAVYGVPWREVVVLRARERARVQRRERDRGDVILPRVRVSGLRGDDRVSRRGKGCGRSTLMGADGGEGGMGTSGRAVGWYSRAWCNRTQPSPLSPSGSLPTRLAAPWGPPLLFRLCARTRRHKVSSTRRLETPRVGKRPAFGTLCYLTELPQREPTIAMFGPRVLRPPVEILGGVVRKGMLARGIIWGRRESCGG